MPFGGPPVAAQRPNPIPSGPSSQQSGNATIGSARYPGIELQPKTRPITHTQLVNEVKGIYVGLAMVESKCMEIDNEQSANIDPQNRLEDDQWQALLALHRTLLHEHHDFMLASQHPSASPALRRVAQKYAMPARMWRHGIHSFLELLRHRLPASREHMITFIYMAYSIIALLYETVRAFEDTWIECLGDLSRYRMAIEDDNFRTRDAWTVVSRRWYSLASDRAPTTGRLHHHLAILARPYVITQMYYYVKSLCVPIPFTSTRESIMTLLDPILNNATQHVPPVELAFIKAHAILFKFDLRPTPEFAPAVSLLLDNLDTHIALSARAWTQTGVYMAIVNSCAFLNYGGDDNVLMKVLGDAMNRSAAGLDEEVKTAEQGSPTSGDTAMTGMNNPWVPRPAEPLAGLRRKEGPIVAEPEILQALEPVQKLVTHIDQVVFSRIGDANCHGYIHARLVWMLCMARLPEGMVYVEHGFPWKELVLTLNNLMRTCDNYEKVEREVFMHPQVDKKAEEEKRIREIQLRQQQQQQAAAAAGDNSLFVPTEPPNVEIPPPPPARSDEDKPLPDDWFLRGLLWADYNFPEGWFANMESISDDERLMETASTRLTRKERVLWMACRLAALKIWMIYDPIEHRFEVTEAFGRVDDTKSLDDGDNAPDEDGQQKFKRDEVKADVSMSDTVGSETTGRDEDSDTADFDREEDEGGGVDLFSSMESIGNEQVSRFDPGRDWQPP
ncbi:hypothetical protein SBRCBS47491_006845 [Sporothrix bragantina]|uniref:DNA/RNA-binding domain-containing protein n=1 Tax=Sporothrix bragantina TaxID=671064 RepID=A0ABP0C9G5_9PEZI